MIKRFPRGIYNLVYAVDSEEDTRPNGKRIRVKGEQNSYSEATEYVGKEREYEEVDE